MAGNGARACAIGTVTARVVRRGSRGDLVVRQGHSVLVLISAAHIPVVWLCVSGGNHSVYLERSWADDSPIGLKGEHERLRSGVNNDGGTVALEIDSVVMLIGRQEGTVN